VVLFYLIPLLGAGGALLAFIGVNPLSWLRPVAPAPAPEPAP
jgi:hypothetical protein